jgi:transcriptional regulator of arginine metabolism
MVKKLARQNIVKEFLTTRIISSQEQLMQLLKAEGVRVTQATLSRDFAELGVVRTFNDYGVRYVLSADESGQQLSKLIGLEIMRVDLNENMIVIRTLAGRAQGVAHFIDRMNKEEILGTIAGDDTVLIIPNFTKNIQRIVDMIKEKMYTPH